MKGAEPPRKRCIGFLKENDYMTGQITLFEIMEQIKKPDWAKEIARGLREYCERWGYDWLEKIQNKKTPEQFFKVFCRITKTYFIAIEEPHYSVEFFKDGKVVIKRTGSGWDKRNEDAIIGIEEILKYL